MKRVVICIFLLMSCFCGSLQPPQKRVMIDAFHSLETASPENNMAAIPKHLIEYSFEVKRELLTKNLLKEYEVVILYQPTKTLEDSEITAVVDFVRRGGGLIICGQHDMAWNDESRESYNQLASTFGVTFTSNAVDDPTNKQGCYCTPIVHNLMMEHPLIQGVTQIIMYKPCALRITGDAVAVARGDDDTRTVGADQLSGEDIVLAAATEYERGRVVVIGTHTVFDDSFINEPDNLVFSTNLFAWTSEQANPKGQPQYTILATAAIAGILVLIIAIGMLKRRKKEKGQKE